MFDTYDKCSNIINDLAEGHEDYRQVLSLTTRLRENTQFARHLGDTDLRRSERAEIIDGLNRLSLRMFSKPFLELCPEQEMGRGSLLSLLQQMSRDIREILTLLRS